jgi:hypothetical protein
VLALLILFLLLVLSVPPLSIFLRLYPIRDMASVPLPYRPPPHDAAEAVAQDMADLKLLPGVDRSFSPEERLALTQWADALSAQAATLSPARLAMAVSRLVALSGNGHTTVDLGQRAATFGRVPMHFVWFADGLYIVRATSAFSYLVGARIITIDGRSPEQALADIQPYVSGTAERARALSPSILESPPLLQAIWPDTDGRNLAIQTDRQPPETVIIPAQPPAPDPFAARPIYAITPLRPKQETDWRTVLPSSAPPAQLSLREPERVAYSEPLENDGRYIRINANGNDEYGLLTAQLAAIGALAPSEGWRWVVLDLRFNEGGDEIKTVAFTRALPRLLRRDGSLWILTGNSTFSAAIITTARAKHFLGDRAHIVGETSGDNGRFWTGGGPPLVLRNSGIAINHAYFLYDVTDGCHSISLCYPLGLIYGVGAGDLSPEIKVGWRFSDYAAGRDTVMDTVRDLANRR